MIRTIACLLLGGALFAWQGRNAAGEFDFYVMSLSWSPQHCAERPSDRVQCAGPKPYAFVLHGLWPQYERGFPESCSTAERLDSATAKAMLDIMPSPNLVSHEWSKHGTCSGLTAKKYFEHARSSFQAFRTPDKLRQPMQNIMFKPASLRSEILAANPQLKGNQIAVLCSGRYLQEVRVCLDKNLKPTACSSQVRDRCSGNEVIVRPLR